MKLTRLTPEDVPSIHPENPEGDSNLEFDSENGKMRWTWKANKGYELMFQYDFEGIDIYFYDPEEDSWNMTATEPWWVRQKTADFANQIIEAIEEAGSLEEADLTLDNPEYMPVASSS